MSRCGFSVLARAPDLLLKLLQLTKAQPFCRNPALNNSVFRLQAIQLSLFKASHADEMLGVSGSQGGDFASSMSGLGPRSFTELVQRAKMAEVC